MARNGRFTCTKDVSHEDGATHRSWFASSWDMSGMKGITCSLTGGARPSDTGVSLALSNK